MKIVMTSPNAVCFVLVRILNKVLIHLTAAKKRRITHGTKTSQRKCTITSDEGASGEDEVDDDQRSTTGARNC